MTQCPVRLNEIMPILTFQYTVSSSFLVHPLLQHYLNLDNQELYYINSWTNTCRYIATFHDQASLDGRLKITSWHVLNRMETGVLNSMISKGMRSTHTHTNNGDMTSVRHQITEQVHASCTFAYRYYSDEYTASPTLLGSLPCLKGDEKFLKNLLFSLADRSPFHLQTF